MIVGNPERVAVETVVESEEDGWLLGRFRLWCGGLGVGNWDDCVDLRGCVRWLTDLRDNPRDRYEPGLFELAGADVFEWVHAPVIFPAVTAKKLPPKDAFARFHVSHIGMSSFERWDLLFIKNEVGEERLLWREGESQVVREVRLDAGELERTVDEFLKEWAKKCKDLETGQSQ
jgi:hypothetical protein